MFIIAEIGQAHDGSLGQAHSYIDALKNTGVDAVKFQTHLAEAESSEHEPFRIKFSYEDKTRFDYWKRMEFSLHQWKKIKEHCDEVGLEFMSSPFSLAAIALLEEVGIKRWKIASGEVTNFLLLEKLADTKKPIILSSGMSSFEELDAAVKFLNSRGAEISILQCTTAYPTGPEEIGLNVIEELKDRYSLPVGLSDHSGTIYPALAATAIGAEILEFHVCFDKRMFGPDSLASLTIDEVKELTKGVNFIKTALDSPINKSENCQFSDLKRIFEKSLAVNKDLSEGHTITVDDLETKRPLGYGINASEYQTVVGKRLSRSMNQWEFLNDKDLKD